MEERPWKWNEGVKFTPEKLAVYELERQKITDDITASQNRIAWFEANIPDIRIRAKKINEENRQIECLQKSLNEFDHINGLDKISL
jgi:hypothetical protein